MNIKEAIGYIYSLEVFGIKLGLERIQALLERLKHPEKNIKFIHVTGTNGKGSVCAMLSAILKKAGYKVGLYTSPHVIRFNERIKINDKEIPNKDIARLVNKLKRLKAKATYFEFVTAMALWYFKEKKVDYAIMEVGMGGRLDATNVITPEISIITNIGLEHTKHLGNTIEEIAKEKAGIIKENSIVVTSAEGKGFEVIRNTCGEKNCKLVVAKPIKMECSLKGEFQEPNIGAAVEAARLLNIHEETIKEGLLDVKWPGRFEFVKYNILVDCCHNPDAAMALRHELETLEYRKLILVIGILNDKDYKSMLKQLVPLAAKVIVCKPKTERALEPELIAKEIIKDKEIIEDCSEALKAALKIAQKNDLVLVTGSIYVVGEVLSSME